MTAKADCTNGHARPLEWRHVNDRRPIPANKAQEMFLASGFGAGYTLDGKSFPPLAQWNGYCTRCGHAVEWSSDGPSVQHKRWPSTRASRSRPVFR